MTLLSTKHLTLRIGTQLICEHLNLQCHAGEVWGILGPNGSGKTTLLHSLAGIHRATEGNIFLQEKNIKTLKLTEIAQQLAVLFQDFQAAFPQTVWEYCSAARYPHLAFNRKLSSKDQDIVLQALCSMELEHLRTRNILQLSGGEKRRLSIAAVLSQTPHIYLLDEPTNHLDMHHQLQVMQHFHKVSRRESALVLMTLHDINLAQQFCDRILFMFPKGEMMQGKKDDLLTMENISRLYQHPIGVLYHQKQAIWFPQ